MIELHAAGVSVPGTSGDTGRVLLDPVSCTLAERRIAVIGANGSGKSTLARMVNGLRPATTGRVVTCGLDVARHGAAVRSRVGFVFTDPDAQLVMPTALEDVALSLRRTVQDRAERDDRARLVLARIGLAEHAGTPVHALSGGQKQLLALAGVLATGPEVLVCDEPTTLLDLRWRRVVDGLLEEVDAQLLLVTHDLDAARRADRVLLVDEGRVVADGDPVATVERYVDMMALR
ncbi:energy-coupling factor ABC transporter ATP-binding protein [Actinotalea sp.]|uniref:energy-coupling factor ABC transporter ATP-binding protein n=1 Tax=Actinotalea sp. TaxID=1872145 RepID=UPI00356A016E